MFGLVVCALRTQPLLLCHTFGAFYSCNCSKELCHIIFKKWFMMAKADLLLNSFLQTYQTAIISSHFLFVLFCLWYEGETLVLNLISTLLQTTVGRDFNQASWLFFVMLALCMSYRCPGEMLFHLTVYCTTYIAVMTINFYLTWLAYVKWV